MKAFLSTDWHFGIYINDLNKWLDMMEDYFLNFFIPYLRKNTKQDDILIILGDIYDNRTSIPIIVSYKLEKILNEISKILPVHIIVGNHDLWNKGTNDVNSVRLFDHIDNISVYTETTTLEMCGKKLVLMPWVEKRFDMINELNDNPGDYLFCHSDLNGCRMHLNSVAHRNPDKIDVEQFKGYKRVFSGHIHIRQVEKNFEFIGSPYQMDRNDRDDKKGITILDIMSGETDFVENTHSPVFRKLRIITEDDIEMLEAETNSKDYIDLVISNKLIVSDRKVRRKLEVLLEKGEFTSIEYLDDIVEDNSDEQEDEVLDIEGDIEITTQLDYESYIRKFIEIKTFRSEKFKKGLLGEYEKITEIYQENYRSKST